MSATVQSFFHAATSTWTHIVADPATQAAAIIDPVLDLDPASGRVWPESARQLFAHIRARGLRVEWILETHAHADHLSAADWLKRTLAGMPKTRSSTTLKTGIGAGIVAVQRHFRDVFGLGADFAVDGSQFDRLFADDACFRLGSLNVRVIATPGHTSDAVSYLIGDAVFVGDTLFAPSAGTGRCDFPGADAAMQYRSIQRLYALPDSTRVFLCHDYPAPDVKPQAQSTIGAEKVDNTQLN